MNATNVDPTTQQRWPGTVAFYVDQPGTANVESCAHCIDSIDGTVLNAGHVTVVPFTTHIFMFDSGPVVEYRMKPQKSPLEPVCFCLILKLFASSLSMFLSQYLNLNYDMVVVAGFDSFSIWVYHAQSLLTKMYAGEIFSGTMSFLGGLGLATYLVFKIISTTLVLLVIGND